jgi:NADH:ubiquinone oxidoreductase subunit 5 (subunit L)/multisubunit Na+/H+ antiporter MnhA subunit
VPLDRTRAEAYQRFVADEGDGLVAYATWCALAEEYGLPASAWPEELRDPHGDGVARWSMYLSVGVLTILAVIGGGFQFAGVWTTISDWLEPVAKPLVEASNTQEAVASVCAVVVGLAGIAVAWWIYSARRAEAPRPAAVLEHKFYFDELYDGLFYWPTVALAKALYWVVEEPLVNGSIRGVADAARWASSRTRALQTGLVRSYVLALAAGVTVLVLVFVVVR